MTLETVGPVGGFDTGTGTTSCIEQDDGGIRCDFSLSAIQDNDYQMDQVWVEIHWSDSRGRHNGLSYYTYANVTTGSPPSQSVDEIRIGNWSNQRFFEDNTFSTQIAQYAWQGYEKVEVFNYAESTDDYVGIAVRATDVSSMFSGYFIISPAPIITCDEDPFVITTDTFEIDPTIETPVGPTTDYQKYNTILDQIYGLSWSGGPWNDGLTEREDLAISWDAVTWTPLSEVEPTCMSQAEDGSTEKIYLTAETETFHIRVNDSPGLFADNTNDPDPMTYTIEMTQLSAGMGCDDQFEYDEFADVVGFTGVDSTEELGVLLSNDTELVVGDWYVVKWGSGIWTDNGGAQQISVEYNWLPHPTGWSDLNAGGGAAVWCQTMGGIETLIQAQATNIFLRANDGDANFANNSGTPYYTLYHATFDRLEEGCELVVDIGPLIEQIEVGASQWSGSPVGVSDYSGTKIIPGQWYVLDTTLGPWSVTGGESRYDMAIQTKSRWDSVESPWVELEDFETTCNVELDTFGHRRVIFQAPDDYNYNGDVTYPDGMYYRLRVDREFLGLYSGSMGWKLYGATDQQAVQNDCLDGLQLQVINEFEWIDEKDESGELLLSDTPRWPEYVALIPGATYVVQAPVQPFDQCAGDSNSECKFQVTNDNGATWFVVDDTISPLTCSVKEDSPSNIWKGRFTVTEGEQWKIRVNDTDGNFINNSGSTAFKFYRHCETAAMCIPIDEDDIPGVSVQGGGDVCKIAIVRPGPLSMEALASLGTYVGSWLQYANLSSLRYMAWCPKHTNTLTGFMRKLEGYEPLATISEIGDLEDRIKDDIDSYDWGGGMGAVSIFDMSASETRNYIDNSIFGGSSASAWNGGNVISLSGGSYLPASYTSCTNTFANELPSRLKSPVCFVSAWFRETSARFWIQLSLDIAAIFMVISMIIGAAQELVYMMTGVKPWTKSGASSSIDALADYMEKRDVDTDKLLSRMNRRR